ncbi:MAG TPA: (d)CMP kinase [Bacteroidales bacterium]|nr:(d)CMP kinase [Bacteroidales bacterium]
MNKRLLIAIDGYSSCGKSSFAKLIASEMNYIFIDSGAMYRAVTLFCLRNGLIDGEDIKMDDLVNSLPGITIEFIYNPDSDQYETHLNGENVENEIRSIEVSKHVSRVSIVKEVRNTMVEMQRKIGMYKGIVMDGRDIGTVVFPDADIKIFMTATPEIRAKRRYDELIAKGVSISFEEIKRNVIERDRIDSGREISPLRKADDAILLDNSNMSLKEQMGWFMEIINNRINED